MTNKQKQKQQQKQKQNNSRNNSKSKSKSRTTAEAGPSAALGMTNKYKGNDRSRFFAALRMTNQLKYDSSSEV